MPLLILDNYDSFTYNLVHIVRSLGCDIDVYRNDEIALAHVEQYDKIMLSPGPGIPSEAGIMKQIIASYGPNKAILGICLGHQGIAEVYGGKLFNMPRVLHGVTSPVSVVDPNEYLFKGIPSTFQATHYHSWAVDPETVLDNLKITAKNNAGIIMALRHVEYDIRGIQFHPESVMTPDGKKIIANWLKR